MKVFFRWDIDNVFLNVDKTKELIIDIRKTKSLNVALLIKNHPVEIVSSLKILGIQIFKFLCTKCQPFNDYIFFFKKHSGDVIT